MIVALLLVAAQSSGAAVHVVGMEHRTWHRCVTLKADEQSATRDSVEATAEAVMAACEEEEHQTQRALLDTLVNAANYKKVDALMADWHKYEVEWARKVVAAARSMPLQSVGYDE